MMMPHSNSKVLTLLAFLIIASPQAAQPAMADDSELAVAHLYTSARQISVPFIADDLPAAEDGRPHAAAVLYVSGNRGQSWVRAQKRAMPTSSLNFRAANDGLYWCIIRGESVEHRGTGPTTGTAPDVVVTVDTEKPQLKELVILPTRGGRPLDVIWQIENRSPLAEVEAVITGPDDAEANLWAAPEVTLEAIGRMRFDKALAGSWTIKISFRDMAGNLLEESRQLTVLPPAEVAANGDSLIVPQDVAIITPLDPVNHQEPTPAAPSDAPAPVEHVAPSAPLDDELSAAPAEIVAREVVQVLPTRTLQIDYSYEESAAPPEQVGLWVTSDGGRTWQLDQIDPQLSGAFTFTAAADGHYGFRIHQQRGRQVAGRPADGQAPQREVIIDTKEPVVRWTAPLGPLAADGLVSAAPARAAPPVELRWTIDEPNLLADSLKLEVRPFGQIAWQTVAEQLENTGHYQWTPPDDMRGRVELRLSAEDRAGHQGSARLVLELLAAPLAPLPPLTGDVQRETADTAAADEARRAYEKARYARLQQRWDDAEKQLLRAVSLNPDYGPAWSDLGGIYLRDDRLANAADAYTRATELLPDSANALYGLARAQAARKDFQPALKTLSALLSKSPTDADAWLLNGDVLWQTGEHDQARQSWMKSMGLGGGSRGNLAALQQRLELATPPAK